MEAMQAWDKYSDRVEASLAPSARGRVFVASAAATTLALALATPLTHEVRALAACWVALAALRAMKRLGASHRLHVDAAGEVSVDGTRGSLHPGSFVAPWLATVRWRPAGAWFDRSLLVAPDMMGADEFRRLRVLLRYNSPPKVV
jgi:hypothetical protein